MTLLFPLGTACTVKLEFDGQVTQGEVDSLIELLNVLKKSIDPEGFFQRRKDDIPEEPEIAQAS